MTKNDADQLFTSVSATVLAAITSMVEKQQAPKPICLDSISLVLKIKLRDLEPIIEKLRADGEILVHRNPSTSKRASKPDSISLN